MSSGQKLPRGLVAHTTTFGGEELVIISYPVSTSLETASLSEAERDVVAAVLEGKTNRAIAKERGRSPRTVANQLASAFRKLGVASRSELAARGCAV